MMFYDHTQSTPATVWTITHNLGHHPVHDVLVYDGPSLVKCFPAQVVHVDENTLQLTFTSAKTGKARLA